MGESKGQVRMRGPGRLENFKQAGSTASQRAGKRCQNAKEIKSWCGENVPG